MNASLYRKSFENTQKLLQEKKYREAYNELNKFDISDTDTDLCKARFLLYSTKGSSPYYDPEQAKSNLDTAVERGDVWATCQKGKLLLNGYIYDKNINEADDLFASVSEVSIGAKYFLGVIAADGLHIDQDGSPQYNNVEAESYFRDVINNSKNESFYTQNARLRLINLLLDKTKLNNSDLLELFNLILTAKEHSDTPQSCGIMPFAIKLLNDEIKEKYSSKNTPQDIDERAVFEGEYIDIIQSLKTIEKVL